MALATVVQSKIRSLDAHVQLERTVESSVCELHYYSLLRYI